MKTELEFYHDSDNSKIWIIEKKSLTITISFGKKNSTMNNTVLKFKTEKEALDEFKKRVKQKIKKGYQPIINTKQVKTKKSKSKSKSTSAKSVKSVKKHIYTQNFSPYINDLINFAGKVSKLKYDGTYKTFGLDYYDDNDEINERLDNEMEKVFDKNLVKFQKVIDDYQNKKVSSFLQSGVIVKNIPTKIATNLLNAVNKFAEKTPADYHPNSNNKVRDIVHPSLYPLLVDIKIDNINPMIDFWNRKYEESDFQWLPSEFEIDADGKCKIMSYINNLPIEETDLYSNIEKMFEYVLPQLEDVWSYSNSSLLSTQHILNGETNSIFKKCNLKNRTLQVITKIVTIKLKSKDDLLGAWHIEGMPHENIVTTASCTIDQDEDFEGQLFFKRIYTSSEENKLLLNLDQYPITKLSNFILDTYVPLGKVDLKNNNLIVFPNSHIHKVDMFNKGKNVQSRTIVVFWLINPNVRIFSTKDIKQQNYSLKTAYTNRLKLMAERTFHKQSLNNRHINLCEH